MCNMVFRSWESITKTCLPRLTFYIAKMGYAGLYLFFLFLPQNIDCGSRRGGTNVVRHSMFLAKIFKICITHGQVFVM